MPQNPVGKDMVVSCRLLNRSRTLLLLALSVLLVAACPAIPFGDPVCGWEVRLSAYHDVNGDGARAETEEPVYNARFVIVEVRDGKTQWPEYLGADAQGQAVWRQFGVGFCPDALRVVAEAPIPYTLTTPPEIELVVEESAAGAWGFLAAGPTPIPPPTGAMTCYSASVLRGAVTGRRLAPNDDLWVTRIDKEQPVSLVRSGVESTLSIPGMTEARDPTLTPDGSVWIAGGIGGGVASYDGVQWRRFGTADGLPGDDAFALEWLAGRLWAITWDGPARFDEARERWETFPGLDGVTHIIDSGEGRLWFLDHATLLQASPEAPSAISARTSVPTEAGQTVHVSDAVLMSDGDIWLEGEEGGASILARYSPATDMWTRYTYESTGGAQPVADFRGLEVLPDDSLFVAARYGGFRLIPGPAGDPLAAIWIAYPDFKQQTDSSALRPTSDLALISQLVPVNDAAGYDRLCKVW
jgi:hypothetical protein